MFCREVDTIYGEYACVGERRTWKIVSVISSECVRYDLV